MQLSRKNPIVWWAFWMEEKYPERISLCALFWRCVGAVPLAIMFAAIVVVFSTFLAAGAAADAYTKWRKARLEALSNAGISPPKTVGEWWSETLIAQAIAAAKNKVCPLIELKGNNILD